MTSRKLIFVGMMAVSASISVQAEVITDGSLGPAVTMSGLIEIDPSLGQQLGDNLFHSFERFDLTVDDSAFFTGDVQNIFSRITGDAASQIDGFLAVDGDAHLWMINPNGIVFGENSIVDAVGGFTVLAGDSVRFSDGAIFFSVPESASTLTSAAPEAWGLVNAAAPVIVDGQIFVGSEASLNLIGADIEINQTSVEAPDGLIQLLAHQGEFVEICKNADRLPTLASGTITIRSSFLDAGGDRGGRVQMLADRVAIIEGSVIQADARANEAPQGQLRIDANEFLLDQASLEVDDLSELAGPVDPEFIDAIEINAQDMAVTNGSQISSSVFGSGATGRNVRINAGSLIVSNGLDETGELGVTEIAADAIGAGVGGNIQIQADQIVLDNATIAADGFGGEEGNFSAAGSVIINTADLQMDGASLISTAARGGASVRGQLQINVSQTLRMTAQGDLVPLISVAERDTQSAGGAAQATDVLVINTQNLFVRGGLITTETSGGLDQTGESQGGGLSINAGQIDASGLELSSRSDGSGVAGDIRVLANDRFLLRDSIVSAQADQTDGGNVLIGGNNIVVLTGVEFTAHADGNGGNLFVGSQSGGVPRLLIADGLFEASAISADGGNIRLRSGQIAVTDRSRFDATSVFGTDGQVVFSDLASELPQASERIENRSGEAPAPLRDDCGRRANSRSHSSLRSQHQSCAQ